MKSLVLIITLNLALTFGEWHGIHFNHEPTQDPEEDLYHFTVVEEKFYQIQVRVAPNWCSFDKDFHLFASSRRDKKCRIDINVDRKDAIEVKTPVGSTTICSKERKTEEFIDFNITFTDSKFLQLGCESDRDQNITMPIECETMWDEYQSEGFDCIEFKIEGRVPGCTLIHEQLDGTLSYINTEAKDPKYPKMDACFHRNDPHHDEL